MMNNNKSIENRKEDSKAFGKFILIMVISAFIGAVIGFCSVFMGKQQKDLAEGIMNFMKIAAPVTPFVLITALIIFDRIEERQCRKLYAGWDGEDEELMGRIDMKLSYVSIFLLVTNLAVYFFFGVSMYCGVVVDKAAKTSAASPLLWAGAALAGLLYSMVALTAIQKRIVNFTKEINPEKQGSVYDPQFQKKWMGSCDEGEKLQIYKSAYKSYTATQYTCMALWVITVIGMMSFDFGILPMTCVVIIWLASSLSYCLETMRLSKHPSEIMK